jgi:hypothetical protein
MNISVEEHEKCKCRDTHNVTFVLHPYTFHRENFTYIPEDIFWVQHLCVINGPFYGLPCLKMNTSPTHVSMLKFTE